MPDMIIKSIAKDHLNKVNFTHLRNGKRSILSSARVLPIVKLIEIKSTTGKNVEFVFGRVSNTSFGIASYADKQRV
jgi:hypothetical protein